DAAIDVAFSREMDDIGHAVLTNGVGHGTGIADIPANEDDFPLVDQVLDIGEISGVGELVVGDDADGFAGMAEHPDEVRPDESGSASDENGSHSFDGTLTRRVSYLRISGFIYGSQFCLLAPRSATTLQALR